MKHIEVTYATKWSPHLFWETILEWKGKILTIHLVFLLNTLEELWILVLD